MTSFFARFTRIAMGGAGVVRLEQRRMVVGPGRAQGLDQPGRMFPAFLVRSRWCGTAGGAAEHAVDQCPGPGLAEHAGSGDGFGHRRVVGNAQVPQLIQPHQQERVHVLVAFPQGLGQSRIEVAP